jgi:shikimate dehydrogenase
VLADVPAGEAPDAIEEAYLAGLRGLSVTMPHKAAVLPALDRLSAAAEILMAVNTILRSGDEMIGDNTDGPGFIDGLADEVAFDPAGARCVVAGAGGAARAVVLALAVAGAKEVVVVNRTEDKAKVAAILAGDAGRVGTRADARGADLLVNATPLGMAEHPYEGDGGPFDRADLRPAQVVADLVYHPADTPLLAAAREQGATAVNGLGMLVHQAAHAFRLWTGEAAPVEAMREAASAEIDRRR